MDLLVDGRVPLGGGLSSSHALECGVALAVNDIFELGLDTRELALLTQRAENDFVGAPTGLMDQLASLSCTTGHALFLDTRSLESEQVPLDPSDDGLALLVVDTRVHHALGDGSYADRRAACARGGAAARRPVAARRPRRGLDRRLAGLPDELRRRARHVVRENERVLAAVDAIRARDWAALGALLDGSHASLRDDYEVSCAELDTAVASAVDAGALGARMTGGGFGGSAVALVPHERVTAVRTAVADAFAEAGWDGPAHVRGVPPSAGAGRPTAVLVSRQPSLAPRLASRAARNSSVVSHGSSGPISSARSLVICPHSTVSTQTCSSVSAKPTTSGRAVELAAVRQAAGPGEDRGDRVGRGLLALLVLPVVPGHRAVRRLGLDVLPSGVISTEVIRPSEPKPCATVSDCTSPS